MEEYSTKYSAYNAKEDYKKAQLKILESKRFDRIFNRLLKKIRKAASRGKTEYLWVSFHNKIIKQAIYHILSEADFEVWVERDYFSYTIKW